MYCRNCGKEIDATTKFCPHCGFGQGAAAQQPQYQQPVVNVINHNTNVNKIGYYRNKSKWVAFFLCFFLGEFGVHRFYVGKTGTGIIWLFTFGLCCIGWLLDLFGILFGLFHDKMGQPLV